MARNIYVQTVPLVGKAYCIAVREAEGRYKQQYFQASSLRRDHHFVSCIDSHESAEKELSCQKKDTSKSADR